MYKFQEEFIDSCFPFKSAVRSDKRIASACKNQAHKRGDRNHKDKTNDLKRLAVSNQCETERVETERVIIQSSISSH